MSRLFRFYSKYVVKNIWLYIAFVIIGIGLFLILAMNTKVSIIETFEGTYADDRLILYEVVDYPIEKVYAYKDRSDFVVTYNILKTEIMDGQNTVLFVEKKEKAVNLNGTITIEAEKGYTSLLNIVLGIEKRYVVKSQ